MKRNNIQNIDQYNAIHFDHNNVVVAAGAGTGKTTAMTKRVVRLIEQCGVSIDRMLILTFTNAAADVMKTRIEKLLRQRAFESPDQRQRLLEISRTVDRAHIQTFHSFCLDLIQEYHHTIERIDPVFSVMSEMESYALRKKSVDKAFDRMSRQKKPPQGLPKVYRLFDGVGEPKNLKKYVLNLCFYGENDEEFNASLREGLRFYRGEDAEGFQSLCDEMISDMENTICQTTSYIEKVADDAPVVTMKRKKADQKETESLFRVRVEELRAALDYARRGREIPKSERWTPVKCEVESFDCAGNRYENFQELFLAVKQSVKEAMTEAEKLSQWCRLRKEFGTKEYIAMGKPFVEVLEILLELAKDTQQIYQAEKRKRNLVDFSDQEHFALEILSIEDVQKRVAESFSYVFVDENQDTNRVQNAIIDKVARSASLFKVGDVKQSIYSFRNANPEAFQKESMAGWVLDFLPTGGESIRDSREESTVKKDMEYSEAFQNTTEDVSSKTRAIIRMNMNYRNRPAILEFVNKVFEREMPDLYKGGALVSGKKDGFDEMAVDDPEVSLHVYETEDKLSLPGERHGQRESFDFSDVSEVEAWWIAQKVLWLVQEKNCRFRDIAILYRSTKFISSALRRVFDECHIPLELEDEGGFYDKPEIAMVVSALEGILNPYNDTSFVAMLLSPFFSFTMEDLLELVSLKRHLKLMYYYDVFVSVNNRVEEMGEANVFSLAIPLVRKIKEIYKTIRWFRGISKYVSVGEFLWKLYDEQSFYEQVLSCERGEQIQKNLALFVESMIGMKLPINECLDYLRESERKPRMGESGGDADAVRLMTIHHSKGMEFENVIIGGIFKEYNTRDSKEMLMLNRKAGFALRHTANEEGVLVDHPLTEVVRQTIYNAQRKEELRILYVAMTRAEKRLFFIGATKAGKASVEKVSSNSIAGIVMPYLPAIPFYEERPPLTLAKSERRVHPASALEPYEGKLSIKDRGLQRGRRPNFDKDYALDYGIRCHRALELCDFKQLYEGLLVDGDWLDSFVGIPDDLPVDEHGKSEPIGGAAVGMKTSIKMSVDAKRKAGGEAQAILASRVCAYSELTPVRNFLQSDMARRITCADEVYKEADFVEYTDEGKIQGIIDLYFLEKGEIVLIDYKTDVFSSEEDIERIKKRYGEQMQTYRQFLERVYKRPVKEVYLCLLHGEGRVVSL